VAREFDVIVIGLGGMGSAALFHLADKSAKVLGIEQFVTPHTYGSSHGETRVIREAYFENPIYVPLVQRAYELWDQLSAESGEILYLKTGGIMIGPPGTAVPDGAIRSAKEHNLPHEILSSSEIRKRFPALHPDDDMIGLLEPRAGIVFPEKCVEAHLQGARKRGALISTEEQVLSWHPEQSSLSVKTNKNQYYCRKLIVAAGAWIRELVKDLGVRFDIERQVLHWFAAKKPGLFEPDRFPIHLWEYEPNKMFYGFPDLGSGVKVALHHQGEIVSPEKVDRAVQDHDIKRMRELLARYLPEANGEYLRGTVCLYTNTPDAHFLIDCHPLHSNVILASPCSGHGFKFASSVGEVLSKMALDQPQKLDLSLFCLSRFGSKLP